MTNPVEVFFDPVVIQHEPGPGHPESPARARALEAMLARRGVDPQTAGPLDAKALSTAHRPLHVEAVLSAAGHRHSFDPDTHASERSVDVARRAAGMTRAAVDAVLDAPGTRSFALVRPPGHHATPDRPMGFCFFNNIAVAAEHALRRADVNRVLIVDWDVHHGNGTEACFWGRDDVLVFNTHQAPFYPGTGPADAVGEAAGEGFTINAPLVAGADDADLAQVFREVLVPVAAQYQPDLVLVSAGFDAHVRDPLGGFRVTTEGFAALCGTVRDIADDHAQGRLALALEGGYDTTALAESVSAVIDVLGGAAPPPCPAPSGRADATLQLVRAAHRRFWPDALSST